LAIRPTLQHTPKASDEGDLSDISPKKSYHLVVCSAVDKEESWFFADFMGSAMALREEGIAGHLISCFPVLESFVFLKNEKGIDDMKFGKYGPDGK